MTHLRNGTRRQHAPLPQKYGKKKKNEVNYQKEEENIIFQKIFNIRRQDLEKRTKYQPINLLETIKKKKINKENLKTSTYSFFLTPPRQNMNSIKKDYTL